MITKQVIDHIAHLARLDLDGAEKLRLQKDLTQILTYVDQLTALDLTGVEATSHAVDVQNVFRDDVVESSGVKQAALVSSPSHEGDFFTVPKVI